MQILQTRIKTEFLHTSDGKEIFFDSRFGLRAMIAWLKPLRKIQTVNKCLIDKNFFEKIHSLLDKYWFRCW